MATFSIDFNGASSGNVTTNYNDSTTTNPTVTLFSAATMNVSNSSPADQVKTLVLNISNPEATMAFGGLSSSFSVSFNSATGNITLTYIGGAGGTDAATWTTALQSLTYFNSNDETPTTHTVTFVSAAPASGSYTSSTAANFDTINVICFMAGTLVRTPDGEVAVETLKRGDLVLTNNDGVAKPVSWLGRQTVSAFFADPARTYPIRVKAGALAENVPSCDLLVSPDHALLVDGVMVHAGALVNGTSIVREAKVPTVFTYHHVELDDHSLILAENTPAETFVDNVDRMNFDNWAEHEALYPEGKTVSELPYPRVKAHRQVPVYIRVALAERAEIIGAVKSAVA
jgi:hypothetical protein